MKQLRFLLALILTTVLLFYLSSKHGEAPPLGKFMNPFTGFWQNGEKDELTIPKVLEAEQLSAPVSVRYDREMVPHVFAQNDYDLYFAQGFTLAQHRLWQMEIQVLSTEGRIAEITGKGMLDYDRGQRRKGLKYAALRALDHAKKNPTIMNIMQAYADGVNHYISGLSYAEYPIEYKLLDYAPEPWTPYRSMLLLKHMADMLSGGEVDLENTNALELFGREQFDVLFPDTYDQIDPVVPNGTSWDFEPLKVERPNVNFPSRKTTSVKEKPDPMNGSNNFAVGPDKTADGSVILANEPDLRLNLPSIWYVNQLHAPGINVFGATLPGAPGVIVGFNDSIAWGVTAEQRDVLDWYKIEFRDDRRKEYKYDDKWLKTEKIVERFKVRDEEDYYDTIIHTHYGPVMYDRNFSNDPERTNLAIKWTAHEESLELMTFYELNRAKNYDDYVEALSYYRAPAQNFIFGSVNGDIGIWSNGAYPLKWHEQGKFLMDGTNSDHEWLSYMPHDHKPHVKNPPRGFVSSANQHPADSTYPYYVYSYKYEFYRNRRINDRLNYLKDIRVKDMMKLQHDNFNYRASESLPLMLSLLDSGSLNSEQRKAFLLLRKWDYFNEPELLAPTVYEAWWNQLYPMIWDEFEESDLTLTRPHVFNTIYLMNNDSIGTFFDIRSTAEVETLADLVNSSYTKAMDDLSKWQQDNGGEYEWYRYKASGVTHILRLAPFSVKDIKIGGNRNIVNASTSTHGPSWRMVVQLSKEGVKGWGVYPGSQTGNPGNPKYAHMIDKWVAGEYFSLNFLHSVNEENESIVFTQTLENE